MLSPEEDVEAHALHRRGWTVSAIARHLGRSRVTVRAYLRGDRVPGVRRRSAPDTFARYADYVAARLREDPHVWATALFDEVRELGYDRSYQRFTHELRARRLRPHCEPCAGVRGRPTIEIAHPPGDEIQWDYLELPASWGGAHLLVGTLSYSGRTRGVFCESEDQAHLVEGIDGVLRRLGGTARRWRFDRMAAVVSTGSGRLLPTFLAAAKHYGAAVDVCPPRRGNRKGCVEKKNHFLAQRWWRTARVATVEEAQRSLDRFCERTADALPRHGVTTRVAAQQEHLVPLPALPFPATVCVERRAGASALVAFRGNQYACPSGLAGHTVMVRTRLGSDTLEVVAGTGVVVAAHRLAPSGASMVVRTPEHRAELEAAVLRAFTTDRPCRRKENRPPGPVALAAAAALRGEVSHEVVVDLQRYAELAGSPS
jgi:transposase